MQATQSILNTLYPTCRKILLVPETHSSNPHYWHSLSILQTIIQQAGYQVRIGFLAAELMQPKVIDLPDNKQIVLEPIQRQGDRIYINDFKPCILLLNNDLSAGVPETLQTIEQPIFPSLTMGWASRLKSTHFDTYQKVVHTLAELIAIDPWLISPLFSHCGEVDFVTGEGEHCVIKKSEQVLQQINDKYQHYNIHDKPFVVVKADAGTYGMGVLMIDDPAQIEQLNRKQRNRMKMIKGRQKLSKVIIQEGVYTHELWEQAVAEPVVYNMGHYVVGGFYRVHTGKGKTDNLNAPGMHFEPLAFDLACNMPKALTHNDESTNRFYTYGVIARLAVLAAAREGTQ